LKQYLISITLSVEEFVVIRKIDFTEIVSFDTRTRFIEMSRILTPYNSPSLCKEMPVRRQTGGEGVSSLS
jgi:hypothetical protein